MQVFPPAGAIFTGIGILLAVRIVPDTFHEALLTPTLYRQQKMRKRATMCSLNCLSA